MATQSPGREPVGVQPGGDAVDPPGELPIGHRLAAGAVDEGRAVGMRPGGVGDRRADGGVVDDDGFDLAASRSSVCLQASLLDASKPRSLDACQVGGENGPDA